MKTYLSDQFATRSIPFASILFLLFLRGNSISCRSIFQGEFTEDFTERGHLRLLDDTARITEPEKELLKSIHHTTIDQSQQADAFSTVTQELGQPR